MSIKDYRLKTSLINVHYSKIGVNDKVSRPTLRSVRLPGSHMPTLAIKTKLQRTFLPCFVLRPQRLGATSPREAFGVKVFQS
jgi:hypothetical protein